MSLTPSRCTVQPSSEDKKAAIMKTAKKEVLFAHLWPINKHRERERRPETSAEAEHSACMHLNPPLALSDGGPLAAEEMYISLIHSSDLPGGCLSSDMPLNPKITPLSLRPGCEGCGVITGIPPADSVSSLMHTSVRESAFAQTHISCPSPPGVWQHDQSGSTSWKFP